MTPEPNRAPWLQDADCTLYHGDVMAVLPKFPAESVDCVVTSPPYWGLRDYGTGTWEGGDENCDHKSGRTGSVAQALEQHRRKEAHGYAAGSNFANYGERWTDGSVYRKTCGKCGATRIDQQLGLEPTPEQYVERMVSVFREVRRVLAAHGTVWLNLGDSYSGSWSGHSMRPEGGSQRPGRPGFQPLDSRVPARSPNVPGLKPKDLVGIPWRVAFALQADSWYLRSDIIWAKPNPMPESVTDRPTKAHEYVFLLSKQPRYFFDQEAVREAAQWERWGDQTVKKPQLGTASWIKPKGKNELPRSEPQRDRRVAGFNERWDESEANGTAPTGRNIRSVWEIATQPYPEAHFATFPEELARRCIAAGCPEQVCRVCGKARERVVETNNKWRHEGDVRGLPDGMSGNPQTSRGLHRNGGDVYSTARPVGFTNCDCLLPELGHEPVKSDSDRPSSGSKYRPGIVLDPFIGSGTVAYAARKLGRHSIGIDLNESYLELAARRLQQQSLFAEKTA